MKQDAFSDFKTFQISFFSFICVERNASSKEFPRDIVVFCTTPSRYSNYIYNFRYGSMVLLLLQVCCFVNFRL